MRSILLPVAERIARATYQLGCHTNGWDDTSPGMHKLYLDAVIDAIAETPVRGLVVSGGHEACLVASGEVLAELSGPNLPALRRILADLNVQAELGRETLAERRAAPPLKPKEGFVVTKDNVGLLIGRSIDGVVIGALAIDGDSAWLYEPEKGLRFDARITSALWGETLALDA